MSSEERPVPLRLRDLDVGAIAPGDPKSPSDDPPPAAGGAELPVEASSGAVDAPLRISVVSLTNGPSHDFRPPGRARSARRPGNRPPRDRSWFALVLIAALDSQMSAIAATPCVPPCVAVSPQARKMSRKAPGRLPGSPASPDRVLVPERPCFSCGKRAERLAAKTLGTATVPCRGSLPVSVRLADEHPTRSGAPGAPISLTPSGLTAFLRSRPCHAEEEATVPRGSPALSRTRDWPLDPASAPRRGLEAQDTRTLPLDVKRAYMPCITRFSHD